MPFRHAYISNSAKIFTRNNQLVISQDEEYSIPLEDLSTVMIESLSSTMTTAALSQLAANNVAVFTCDRKHLPNGVLHGFNLHSRHLQRINRQINMKKPFRKRIWQIIIKTKILNQSLCLELADCTGEKELKQLVSRVDSGDSSNVESLAARKYFAHLFGKNFLRRNDDVINISMNYGYALIRGCISRTLVAFGLLPTIGIFHSSELNTNNLTDDFLEPFRPVIDLWVKRNIEQNDEFEPMHKHQIYCLLSACMQFDSGKYNIINSIEKCISSFVQSLEEDDYSLLEVPKLIEFEMEEND